MIEFLGCVLGYGLLGLYTAAIIGLAAALINATIQAFVDRK